MRRSRGSDLATRRAGPADNEQAMAVPHFYQSSEQTCGAACLRMLFAALSVSHDEATIAQHCGLTPLGSTVQDLVAGARALGFNAALLPVPANLPPLLPCRM